jgi:phage terminase small subunit
MATKATRAKLARTKKAEAKHELFARAYVANTEDGRGNGKAAAIAAGYSAKTAVAASTRLLKIPEVANRISVLQQELLDKHALKADDVMRQLGAIVKFDPRKMFREDGSLKHITELDEETASALSGFEIVESGVGGLRITKKDGAQHVPEFTKKVKWYDKNVAVANAMKHFKLLNDDKGPTVNVGIVIMPAEFQGLL